MIDTTAILSRVAEIVARAEKAPKGPWQAGGSGRFGDVIELAGQDEWGEHRLIECPGSGGSKSYTGVVCETRWRGTPEWDATRDFIAASRTDIPDMAGYIRDLVAEVERLRAAVQMVPVVGDVNEGER